MKIAAFFFIALTSTAYASDVSVIEASYNGFKKMVRVQAVISTAAEKPFALLKRDAVKKTWALELGVTEPAEGPQGAKLICLEIDLGPAKIPDFEKILLPAVENDSWYFLAMPTPSCPTYLKVKPIHE